MTLALNYIVSRIQQTSRTMPVTTADGKAAVAEVSIVELEIYDPNGQHGTLTLRFHADEEKAYILGNFSKDQPYTLNL